MMQEIVKILYQKIEGTQYDIWASIHIKPLNYVFTEMNIQNVTGLLFVLRMYCI